MCYIHGHDYNDTQRPSFELNKPASTTSMVWTESLGLTRYWSSGRLCVMALYKSWYNIW